MIAAWMLDLDKILRVFNVRYVARVTTMANFRLPEGTCIKTDAAISSVSHDVTNNHTTAPGTQNDVVNTLAIVSDSHRNALKSPEDACGQSRVVSTIRTLPVVE